MQKTIPHTGAISRALEISWLSIWRDPRIDNAYATCYNVSQREAKRMPGDLNLSMRVDSTLKAQAEEILSDVGLTMSGAFTMFLKQIVRERSVPLSLSLHSSNALYADLLEAQTERLNGYKGRNAREVLDDMKRAAMEVGDGE